MSTHHNRWETGLCDFCSDASTCCLGCFCPCYIYADIGRMARGVQGHDLRFWAELFLYACSTCSCLLGLVRRLEVREKYGLRESPCNDPCVLLLCMKCALCQEHRETRLRSMTKWLAETNDPEISLESRS